MSPEDLKRYREVLTARDAKAFVTEFGDLPVGVTDKGERFPLDDLDPKDRVLMIAARDLAEKLGRYPTVREVIREAIRLEDGG